MGDFRFATTPFRAITWKTALFHVATFPIAIFYFTLAAVGIAVSVGLLIIVIGFFLGYGVIWLIHGMAPVEGWFVSRFLDVPIRASLPEPEGSFMDRYKQMLSSPSTWSRLGYIPLKLVLSIAGFASAIAGVSSIAAIATPLLYQQEWFSVGLGDVQVDTLAEAIGAALVGVVLVWVFLYLSVLLGRVVAVVARAMISDPLGGA